ncbi:MAG TPA: hypothetical protein VJ810_33170 [Blastocatellia bacterium]|nr:hypothetical protein [Blastocatellia bacterium]
MTRAAGHFQDGLVKQFLDDAQNSDSGTIVTIEQGTHQPEDTTGGGFKLHFTGRDQNGKAFHFYVQQLNDGALYIPTITYMGKGGLVTCNSN